MQIWGDFGGGFGGFGKKIGGFWRFWEGKRGVLEEMIYNSANNVIIPRFLSRPQF